MPNRDDRDFGGGDGSADRGGRDQDDRARTGRDEQRSFGEDQPWRRERYGSQAGADRNDYGSGYDRQSGGYGRGQEVGRGDCDPQSIDPRDRGVREFGPPADYAYRPQAGHEFDPDYSHWRDEQLKRHDRDYGEWRRAQHQQYDEDYHRFRSERREHFGRTFQDWRSQRSAVGGVPDTGVAPGVGSYGDAAATPGYSSVNSQKPSGMLEPSLSVSADPALAQAGRVSTSHASSASAASGASTGSEFGKEPAGVQATTDGATRDPKDHEKH